MHNDRIQVLLVDDHLVVRNGVRMMLSSATDMVVCAEAENARAALHMVEAHTVHVAVVDIGLPDTNGLDLLRQLKARQPELAVLILSMYSEDIYAVRAIKLGAAGYLTKDCPATTLIEAIRRAAEGKKYITPALANQLAFVMSDDTPASHESLTNRELEVFKLIASGESLVNISEKLHLSASTITTYRTRILKKMQLKNNIELAKYALHHGMQ